MSTTEIVLTYFGTLTLVLTFLYGTREYLFSLIAGYVVFCVFFFKFSVPSFEWTINSMMPYFLEAGKIFIISYAIGVLIYRLLPYKKPVGA